MMRKPFLLLTLWGSIVVAVFATALVIALWPYMPVVGWAVLGLLAVLAVGVLVYFIHHLLIRMQTRRLERDLKRIQVEAARRELDYVRPNEHGAVTAIRTGEGYQYTPPVVETFLSPARRALLSPRSGADLSPEPVIPHAPAFREMCHLIRPDRLVLCYTEHGPAFGSIEDLLSMAIVGKPGRGKTTALLYYVAMLLNAGAEVHVWDPHGSMNELAGCHPHLSYTDTLEDLPTSLSYLERDLADREARYKQGKQVRHPLLLLVDELPVIADYEKTGKRDATTPTQIIKRFVLEGRKWRCFFIASGQSTDAEILPTRVTENLSSRIIFFSSDRRARMAGLEQDAIKKFLPVIRRAGSGVMIFDCSSWDEPVLGAIPETTVLDLEAFLLEGPRALTAQGGGSFPSAPAVPFSHPLTGTGSLILPGTSGKDSPPPVERFPAFPTRNAHRAETPEPEADALPLPDISGRSGTARDAAGNPSQTGSQTLERVPGTAPQEARKVKKAKAITWELYTRIRAEYDRGTPRSEVCARLRIGNDYYPTIRAAYQQFDLERQRSQGKTSAPYTESEEE